MFDFEFSGFVFDFEFEFFWFEFCNFWGKKKPDLKKKKKKTYRRL